MKRKRLVLLIIFPILSIILFITFTKTETKEIKELYTYKYDKMAEFTTIGTGGIKGMYYLTGNIISDYVNNIKEQTGIRLYVESTAGSVYNIKAIKRGEFDFAIVQADTAYQALNGEGKFKGKSNYKLKSVMSIYPELLTLITRSELNINTLNEIKDKRVNIGQTSSGTEFTVNSLFKYNNILKSDLSYISQLNIQESMNALINNKIDAYFIMSGHPSNIIQNNAELKNIKIISIDSKETNNMINNYPYLTKEIIEANTYKNQSEEVKTLGVKAILVTSSNVSEKIVYTITKAIVDNLDKFKQTHPMYSHITKESLLEGLSLPLHRGAKEYFEEIKIIK